MLMQVVLLNYDGWEPGSRLVATTLVIDDRFHQSDRTNVQELMFRLGWAYEIVAEKEYPPITPITQI